MSEVNYEAAKNALHKIRRENGGNYEYKLDYDDMRDVLDALCSPVEQKTCTKHNWIRFSNQPDDFVCSDCGTHAMANVYEPKQEDLSLAGKLEHRCRVHLSVETTNKLKDCCIYDLLAHEAESHYAPIIEASYHEGYSMGQKNACPKDLEKAKEEGRKEGIKLAQLAILNIMDKETD